MSSLNVHAKVFFPFILLEQISSPKEQAIHQLRIWNFSTKDQKIVASLLDEWYTSRTLNSVLQEWESVGPTSSNNQKGESKDFVL